MKKIISFISLSFLMTSTIAVGMDKAEQTELKSNASTQMGDPDAKPFCFVTPEGLQSSPIFQKLKQQAAPLEEAYDIKLEDIFLLPSQQQKEFIEEIEQQENFLAISQSMSSAMANNFSASEQREIEAKTSDTTSNETKQDTTATTTSGLSWRMLYLQKAWGNQAALEHALNNNQFDKKNTDHVNLLESSMQACTKTHKTLNATYKQQTRDLKAEQCYTIVALLKKLEENIAGITLELEKIKTEQTNKKEALLQQHQLEYENNNATLQKLQTVCSKKSILNDSYLVSAQLDTCPKLQKELHKLNDLHEKTTEAACFIQSYLKPALDQMQSNFAIENNK